MNQLEEELQEVEIPCVVICKSRTYTHYINPLGLVRPMCSLCNADTFGVYTFIYAEGGVEELEANNKKCKTLLGTNASFTYSKLR